MGHRALQDALDTAQCSETKTCGSDMSTPPPSKDEGPPTPRDAKDITHHSRSSKPSADQRDDALPTPKQTYENRQEQMRRSKSLNNPARNSRGTPRVGNGASNTGGNHKPAWRVKASHARDDTPGVTMESDTHTIHHTGARQPDRHHPYKPLDAQTTQHAMLSRTTSSTSNRRS